MEYGHGGGMEYLGQGMLDFSANINPFGPSEAVRRAAKSAVDDMGHYPDSQCRRLRGALAKELGVQERMILCGNGAADLIFSLVFARKPLRAVLASPCFSEYAQALRAAGCRVCWYRLDPGKCFDLQEDFLELLMPETDMVFLGSPNNPTGRVVEGKMLEKVLHVCEQRDIRMVVDECFYEFVRGSRSVTMLPFVPGHPALFVLRAFTKIHAMPGLRLGYALCSDAALLERIELARQPWSVSGVAQAAGLAALGEKHRAQQARDYVAAERERLQRGLGRLGIAYVPSDANYILFHSPGPAGEKMAGQAPGADLFSLLLERGICIRDCQNFEGLSAGYYRIAVRKQEENDRLLQALGEIYGRVPAAQSSGFGEDGQWQNQS